MNFVSFNVSAGNDITEDIKELNSVAIEFFQVKSDGEKKNQMRKENLAWQSEKMAENEDELRLIGKPASLNNVNEQTPSTCIDGEVSLVKVNRVTNDGPPKKRKSVVLVDADSVSVKNRSDSHGIDHNSGICKRKIDFTKESDRFFTGTASRPSKNKLKKNRSVEVIDYIDTQTSELQCMFTQIANNLAKTESPKKTLTS